MKYKVYITYQYFDSAEIEAENYDDFERQVDEYIENSTNYGYDTVDWEYETEGE